MIERHFGRGDKIAETVAARDLSAGVVDRLQRLAGRVTAARQELAREEVVRSRGR